MPRHFITQIFINHYNLKNKKLKYAGTNEVTYKYINSKLKLFVISRKVKNTSEFKINTELLITNQNVFFSTVFLFSFIKTIIILCQKIFLSSG